MKKVILFDIDYTLFDSLKFRRRILSEIKKHLKDDKHENIEEILDRIYFKSRKRVGYFDPGSFISEVNKIFISKIPKSFLNAYVKKEELREHLYEEVERILEKMSQEKNLIVGIFSGGDKNFQREKIKDLLNYFHTKHIHIFPYKIKELELVIGKYKDYKLFLIDDVLAILHKAKQIDKSVFTIWIKRGRSSFLEKEGENFIPDVEIKNLDKILSIIKKN